MTSPPGGDRRGTVTGAGPERGRRSRRPAAAGQPMPPDHPGLIAQEVLARGGWHPRYARVLAVVSDGDYGFAVVDGNGDGAELDTEIWRWNGAGWIRTDPQGHGFPAPAP